MWLHDCFAYFTTSQSHLNCLCVCKPLTNGHNPVSLKDAIWPFAVTALMEMNRTSMVCSVLIQLKLLCRLNWLNLDFCFLSLTRCNSASKGSWWLVSGNRCIMTERNSANVFCDAGAFFGEIAAVGAEWGWRLVQWGIQHHYRRALIRSCDDETIAIVSQWWIYLTACKQIYSKINTSQCCFESTREIHCMLWLCD